MRGGLTFWGTIGTIQKTYGLTHRQVLWEESWVNLIMKLRDTPYYHHFKKGENRVKQGTEDDLKKKFSKYMKK